ncbi:hypothetical protein K5L04_06995 [Flavobacterium psychrophilum]|uniref:hypothetical protein n=1 Tax=Flavobacterium psychrophilum TaxID=96345 RepID=UPI00106A09C2|nr:hypothetical protein [Flavobacterium psychrophilum]EKT4553265.1 hypothetical protein [Flavobacterium psychrophilum]ELY1980221.1 hypothetical protein [Flavobacterium psychrophilum]QZK99478.1 hypothetical protein K5L04_06995 [Flavobacterium psychrophilum]
MNFQEYNILNDSINNWLKEKEDYDLRRNKVFGLNPKFYLWVFGILFVYVFFKQEAKFSESKNSSSLPSASNYILYEKPNDKSTILLQENSSIEVKILDETKYYYKVEFTKDDKSYSGFIKKDNVLK